MAERKSNDLGRDPIGKLLLRMAVPSVVAQLVNALYNIVDRIYIGHMDGMGDLALAGLGVCYPIIMFVSALSALVGMGGGSRAVVKMGEGNDREANAILGGCITLLLSLSVIITVVCQIYKRPMLLLFGATENTVGYAAEYLEIYLFGTAFALISLGLNSFITAQGFSTVSMRTTLIGTVVNLVLDPVFIFGFGMGVRGAALATVIAQGVSAWWVLRFLTGKQTKLRLQRRYLGVDMKVMAPVLALGISPFVMRSTESLVNIAFNSSLKAYGGDAAVGAMTICHSVMHMFSLVELGIGYGAQPIIGYNYGSGDFARAKKAIRMLLISGFAVSTTGWLLVHLIPGFFVGLYNDKPALTQTAVWALQVYSAGSFMLGIQNPCQQTFLALGQAKVSLFLSVLRKIIVLVPLILILPNLMNDKLLAVFAAEPATDILATAVTAALFFWKVPKIFAAREKLLAGKAH